jgi:hypothetical protein
MNYAYFMYTSLCDWTNTCRLNWSNFLSFLLVQLNREKTKVFFLIFPTIGCIAQRSDWSVHGAKLFDVLTGHSTD